MPRPVVTWAAMTSPPGSTGLPFVGEALAFLSDPFVFTMQRTKRHGNVWKTKILGDTVVVFAGPKAFSFFMAEENFTRENGTPKFLQELLHPDAVPFLEGDRHKTRKRLLLSAFKPEALASYLPGMFSIMQRFVDGWCAGVEQAIADDLGQLGFDIADYLFAASDPAQSNKQGARDFAILNRGAFSPPINLPFTAYGKAIKARDRLRGYIKQQIAEKDGAGTALGVLKTARGPNGEALSTAELEIEMLHFFFAAHGGLTAALAWILVTLGERPELAAKLREEADRVLGASSGARAPTMEQIAKLDLARSVSREVLRAFPIVPTTFFGIAKRDLEVDGYSIRAGWKGVGALWATLQDGSTFRDPSELRADRLGDDVVRSLPDNAYVPQGGGPPDGHRCAGEQMIKLVMPAFAAWFLKNYELAWPAQDSSAGKGGVGPLPKSGVRVKITKRAPAA